MSEDDSSLGEDVVVPLKHKHRHDHDAVNNDDCSHYSGGTDTFKTDQFSGSPISPETRRFLNLKFDPMSDDTDLNTPVLKV